MCLHVGVAVFTSCIRLPPVSVQPRALPARQLKACADLHEGVGWLTLFVGFLCLLGRQFCGAVVFYAAGMSVKHVREGVCVSHCWHCWIMQQQGHVAIQRLNVQAVTRLDMQC
jgi:hypothetical protein